MWCSPLSCARRYPCARRAHGILKGASWHPGRSKTSIERSVKRIQMDDAFFPEIAKTVENHSGDVFRQNFGGPSLHTLNAVLCSAAPEAANWSGIV